LPTPPANNPYYPYVPNNPNNPYYPDGYGGGGGYSIADSPKASATAAPTTVPEKIASDKIASDKNKQPNAPQAQQQAAKPLERPSKVVSYITGVELNTLPTIRYIYGFEDSTVRAWAGITRAQFAQVIFNLALDAAKENADPTTITATDVNKSAWYAKAIAYALAKGVFKGYPDGTFRPEQVITRAELCAILYTYFDFSSLDLSAVQFTDIGGHWAEGYIKIVAAYSVVSGYPDGGFKPDQMVTRAEFVSMMNRLLMRLSEFKFSLEANEYVDLDDSHWAYDDIMNASGKTSSGE
jgi:hypothetical protein